MDTSIQPQSQQQQGHSRARVTVVCAECKRLKLKCDRQQPCASCVKRATIPKCQYTAAAAEKVDVHSVHNRLVHVEGFLITSTNGQFQPTYPSTNQPSSSSTVVSAFQSTSQQLRSHHHHHHYAAPLPTNMSDDTVSRSFKGLTSTFLEELGISTSNTSTGNTGTPVKLEASPVDNHFFRQGETTSSGHRSTTRQLGQFLQEQRNTAHAMLPSITVYLPQVSDTESASNSPHSQSHFNKPQVTAALLGLFPPLHTCQQLLQNAGEVFRIRPLWFDPVYGAGNGWKGFQKRCLQILSSVGKGTEKERKQKVADMKRAEEIYFAGLSQPQRGRDVCGTLDPPNEGAGSCPVSLTFFAIMCAVLAIGAASAPSRVDSESPPFFFALSQQALGIWDTNAPKDDSEETEYVIACLLGVIYLLISGTLASIADGEGESLQGVDAEGEEETETEDAKMVSSLVGKMVNVARGMHLDRESTWAKRKKKKAADSAHPERLQSIAFADSGTGSQGIGKKEKEGDRERLMKEWKRIIWWEIVFYDLFIADVLGQQPHLSTSPYSTKLPRCAIVSNHNALDGEKTSSEDENVGGRTESRSTRGPPPASHRGLADNGIDGAMNDIEVYFGARYRLVQVVQAIKRRNSLLDCCCGYTLDQAAALESEIRTWQEELPSVLKIQDEISNSATTTWSTNSEKNIETLQAFELAIIANVLVVSVYTPFVRASEEGNKSPFSGIPAVSSCVHASQAIIHLTKGLQSFLSSAPAGALLTTRLPVMFDIFPLDNILFQAIVVCAYAAFAGKAPLTYSAGAYAEDVGLGLKVLSALSTLSPFAIPGGAAGDNRQVVADALQRRLVQRVARLKRKHDRIDEPSCEAAPESDTLNSLSPASGDGENMISSDVKNQDTTRSTQAHSQTKQPFLPPVIHHTFVLDPMSSRLSTVDSVQSGLQNAPPQTQFRPTATRRSNKDRGQKEKKVDKPQLYPRNGVRVRVRDPKQPSIFLKVDGLQTVSSSQPRSPFKAGSVFQIKQEMQVEQATSPPCSPSVIIEQAPTSTSHAPSDQMPDSASYASSPTQIHQVQINSLPFATPHSPNGIEMPPRKRQNLHDVREPVPPHYEHMQPISSQTVFVHHVHDQGHQQTHQNPMYDHSTPLVAFDDSLPAELPLDGSSYGGGPSTSPFSNASTPPFPSEASPEHSNVPGFSSHLPFSSADANPSPSYMAAPTPYAPISSNAYVQNPQMLQQHHYVQNSPDTSYNSQFISHQDEQLSTSTSAQWLPASTQSYWGGGSAYRNCT